VHGIIPLMDTPAAFRPERFSRRGELTAWGLAVLVFAAWIALAARGQTVPSLLQLLAIFLLLAGLAISLTNWIDRHTLLRLETDGVNFENGLRRVHLAWDEIRQVQVFPSNLGDRVRVVGEKTFFSFRKLDEVVLRGQVKGRMGFADGERILQHILEKAHLEQLDRPGFGYYYARK
jgi:hypothetical protein